MAITKTSPSQYELTSYDVANKLHDFAVTVYNNCRKQTRKEKQLDANSNPVLADGEFVYIDVDYCVLSDMEEADTVEIGAIAASGKAIAAAILADATMMAGVTSEAAEALTLLAGMEVPAL